MMSGIKSKVPGKQNLDQNQENNRQYKQILRKFIGVIRHEFF